MSIDRPGWLLGLLLSACVAGATTQSGRQTSWSITFLGDSTDPRFTAVREAVAYWNNELASIGVPLRLGPVTTSAARSRAARPSPRSALTRNDSAAEPGRTEAAHLPPLSVPNVARNVAAWFLAERGSPRDVARAFDAITTLFPAATATWYGLADNAITTGDTVTARRALDELLRLAPTHAGGLRLRALMEGRRRG
ncbi:MAG: hypothetical protein ACT4PM_15310 [Gemmatimonadales bacterium]